MRKAEKALAAFTMTDMRKDAIRRRYLQEIGTALNTQDK